MQKLEPILKKTRFSDFIEASREKTIAELLRSERCKESKCNRYRQELSIVCLSCPVFFSIPFSNKILFPKSSEYLVATSGFDTAVSAFRYPVQSVSALSRIPFLLPSVPAQS